MSRLTKEAIERILLASEGGMSPLDKQIATLCDELETLRAENTALRDTLEIIRQAVAEPIEDRNLRIFQVQQACQKVAGHE